MDHDQPLSHSALLILSPFHLRPPCPPQSQSPVPPPRFPPMASQQPRAMLDPSPTLPCLQPIPTLDRSAMATPASRFPTASCMPRPHTDLLLLDAQAAAPRAPAPLPFPFPGPQQSWCADVACLSRVQASMRGPHSRVGPSPWHYPSQFPYRIPIVTCHHAAFPALLLPWPSSGQGSCHFPAPSPLLPAVSCEHRAGVPPSPAIVVA